MGSEDRPFDATILDQQVPGGQEPHLSQVRRDSNETKSVLAEHVPGTKQHTRPVVQWSGCCRLLGVIGFSVPTQTKTRVSRSAL